MEKPKAQERERGSEQEQDLFWADNLASVIAEKRKFHYLPKTFPKPKKFVVKTSASISGVLHIGRLSDTIRSESAVRALHDRGENAELIWVAEDMDPLRKVPEGIPPSYEKYIGMPVTDIPDPDGCHKSYAEHNTSEYFKVLDKFVGVKMKKYSTREEYKKGSFAPYIKKLLASLEQLKEIQNKYRSSPLAKDWSPWQPICDKCGKIITPRILNFDGHKVEYECKDYEFETRTARGCGHRGENDPLKGKGKLVWKSEWASEWALWNVSAEGAGKEYQVPGSAWWVNSEICEKILSYPAPEPIFYEHIMIDGRKMSASLGNVIYPADWLRAAPPELLRFFYNKRLMKTRSFSWKDLPLFYDDYDVHEKVFFGEQKLENKKEEAHMKRLFELSQLAKPYRHQKLPFTFAALVVQTYDPEKDAKRALEVFESTGHLQKVSTEDKKYLQQLLVYAKNWLDFMPEMKLDIAEKVSPGVSKELSTQEKKAIKSFALFLQKEKNADGERLQAEIYETAKSCGIEPKRFFEVLYRIIINKPQGPKLGPFVIALGRERVAKILAQV